MIVELKHVMSFPRKRESRPLLGHKENLDSRFHGNDKNMKYRPQQYAQALFAACEQKSDAEQKKIVKRFAELLVRHQAIGKTSAICAAYEKLELRSKGMRNVRLETVDGSTEKLKMEIHAILGKHIHIEETTNSNLLGGLKILIDGEILIDASAQRQMKDLFIATSERHHVRF